MWGVWGLSGGVMRDCTKATGGKGGDEGCMGPVGGLYGGCAGAAWDCMGAVWDLYRDLCRGV